MVSHGTPVVIAEHFFKAATLSAQRKEVLIAAREFLRLSFDDLRDVVRECFHQTLSLSALALMLGRRQVPISAKLLKQDRESEQGSEHKHKPFKDCEPSIVHVDMKYLS